VKIKQAMLDSIRRTVTEKLAGSDLGPSGYTDSGKFLNSVDKTIEDYRAATPETRASMRESGLLSAPEPYTMAPDTRDLEQTYGIDRGSLTYLPVPGKFDSGYDPINGVVYADTEDSDSSAITAHEVSHAESMGKQSVPRALGEAIPTQLAMMLGGGIPLGALAGYIYKKRFPGNVPSTTRRAVQLALGNPGFMAGHVLQTGTPKGIRNVGIAAALGSLAFLPRLIEETKANTRSAKQLDSRQTTLKRLRTKQEI